MRNLKVGDIIISSTGRNDDTNYAYVPLRLQIMDINEKLDQVSFRYLEQFSLIQKFPLHKLKKDLATGYVQICPEQLKKELIKELINE